MKLPAKLEAVTAYDPPQKPFPPIKLDANESFIPWEEEALSRVLAELGKIPLHRYPDPSAADACQAAADWFGVEGGQIVAGNGSDELISILFSAFLPRGAQVVLCDPDFSMYAFYAQIYELVCIPVAKKELRIDVDEVIRTAKDARMVIVSNPCNPTGQGLRRAEILRLAAHLPDCLVVIDEAYMDFWDQSVIDAIPQYDNLLILRTCSKAFGLAGLRLGFALGQKPLIEALQKIRSPFNINALTQTAAAVLLREKELLCDHIQRILDARRHLEGILDALSAQRVPTHTNFVLVKLKGAARCQAFLARRGISVRVIMGDFLRVTAGAQAENEAFGRALEDFWAKEMER